VRVNSAALPRKESTTRSRIAMSVRSLRLPGSLDRVAQLRKYRTGGFAIVLGTTEYKKAP